ncbi:Pyridoxine 4-dehydrogenase [Lobaria immixta]|nr:Pyridoxine 4-dehydrogenase [Lobaria immixta]
MHLLAKCFAEYPEHAKNIVLAIKGGINKQGRPDGTREDARRSVDNVIRTLDGKMTLDIFEYARVDETTIAALAEYVQDGKLKGISWSEVNAEIIGRAHKVKMHPISCVEVEFSLWATDILENDVAAICEELGIPIVAYSPLGSGFLTGEIKSRTMSGRRQRWVRKIFMQPVHVTPSRLYEAKEADNLPKGDLPRQRPKVQPEVIGKNLEMAEELEKQARNKGCSPDQLALAWVNQQSGTPGLPEIIPISRCDDGQEGGGERTGGHAWAVRLQGD